MKGVKIFDTLEQSSIKSKTLNVQTFNNHHRTDRRVKGWVWNGWGLSSRAEWVVSGWKDGWIGGWVGGGMGGYVHGWAEEWVDGWAESEDKGGV